MFPPHEIKAKEFTHVLRGYSAPEVDEYTEFVLQKYTELYRENDALENRIKELESELESYRNDDKSIRDSLVEANKRSKQIVTEAEERSKIILHSAKINCDRILSEFRSAVSEERDELLLLRGMVKKFKEELFSAYQTHIEYIEKIAPELDELDESEFSDESIIKLVVESIKGDILSGNDGGSENTADDSHAPEEISEETPDPEVPSEKNADNESKHDAGDDKTEEPDAEAEDVKTDVSDAERGIMSDTGAEPSDDAEFGSIDDARDGQLSFEDLFPDSGLRGIADKLESEGSEIDAESVTDISDKKYGDTVNAVCAKLADAENTGDNIAAADSGKNAETEVTDDVNGGSGYDGGSDNADSGEDEFISDVINDSPSDYYEAADDVALGAERTVLHSDRSGGFKMNIDDENFSDDDDEFIRSLKSIKIEGETSAGKTDTEKNDGDFSEKIIIDSDESDDYIGLINEINASGRKRRRR